MMRIVNCRRSLKKHEVQKKISGACLGKHEGQAGRNSKPVGRHTVDRKKMSTNTKRGKEAHTFWKVIERYGVATLLEVEIKNRAHSSNSCCICLISVIR